MKSNTVFHISEGMIKFLQVSGMAGKPVTAVGMINIANQSDEQISQALSALMTLRKLNLSESRVTLVVTRSRVILRTMQFPSHKDDEILSMINLQISNHIPYSREEVEIDFHVLSKTADGHSKVMVVVIPQETVIRYRKIFLDARIPLERITISSIGLWSLYRQQPGLSEKPGIIVDVDHDQSEICLCDKEHCLASREIPVGFTQSQQAGYVEIINQCELMKNNLAAEEFSLERVYLVSTASREGELEVEMAEVTGDWEVKEISLTKLLKLGRGVQWPELMMKEGVSVASLAGIALSSQKPPIDLTPRTVRQAQEQRTYQRQLVISGIWLAAALISLVLALAMGFISKNFQLARLEDQLRGTKFEAFKVKGQLQKVYDIEDMIKGRLIFSELVHEIYRLLPRQTYLVSVTISNGDDLTLQGVSSNPIEINQFQKGMAASRSFSNVNLDYVNKRATEQGELNYFKITCSFKSGGGKK